jgi:hypothetical protein
MPSAKLALAVGLAAISLSACGTSAKPEAGTLGAVAKNHKGIDDPRKKHITCLRQDHVPVTPMTINGEPAFQVGTAPIGPTVVFTPTAGAAQELQIDGQVQAAEVIGSALLYPNQASEKLLSTVEGCVAEGVSG